jgi:hypothetical protein
VYNELIVNTAQQTVINTGVISFLTVLLLTLFLNGLTIYLTFFLLMLICVVTAIFYKSASASENALPSHIKNKVLTTPVPAESDGNVRINTQKLDNLVTMTEYRLFKLSSIFPFQLFQDDIIIEQKQVIIIKRNFFFSSQQYPFSIKDILAPIVETSLFFAKFQLKLGPGSYRQDPPSVSYLGKDEAQKARRIIMGLIVCDKENVDLNGMAYGDILKKVEEIGRFNSK